MTCISKTVHSVSNRGIPPIGFLNQLIDWGKAAPAEVFSSRKDDPGETDIYTSINPTVGSWHGELHRRAAMLEVLMVLAGFESSWKSNTGADITNPKENNDETYSAGLWQISYNSRVFGDDLMRMLQGADIRNGKKFQEKMKADFNFAAEYTARLLRHTIRHNGPIKGKFIHPWLRKEAIAEYQQHLANL